MFTFALKDFILGIKKVVSRNAIHKSQKINTNQTNHVTCLVYCYAISCFLQIHVVYSNVSTLVSENSVFVLRINFQIFFLLFFFFFFFFLLMLCLFYFVRINVSPVKLAKCFFCYCRFSKLPVVCDELLRRRLYCQGAAVNMQTKKTIAYPNNNCPKNKKIKKQQQQANNEKKTISMNIEMM